MPTHHKEERTLVVIKPDGIHRNLIGEIIGRYEKTGLKLVGMKMLNVDNDFVEKHYTTDPDWIRKTGEKIMNNFKEKGIESPHKDPHVAGRVILKRLQEYFTSGPVVALVWEGSHAVAIARKITGGTEPLTSPIGSIRGDLVVDSYEQSDANNRSIRNLVHASGTIDEAKQEIANWFTPNELVSYKHLHERILYDENMAQ